MKKGYDFSRGKIGAIAKTSSGKTRITIRIDDDILEWFRSQAHSAGGGKYQSLINQALREHTQSNSESFENALRVVIREELAKYSKNVKRRQ
jgi:Arc/MetJ family transcription regulator